MNEYHALPYITGTPCVRFVCDGLYMYTPEDFYSYFILQDLVDKAAEDKEIMMRCRSVGILQSVYGRFYLTDLDSPTNLSGPVVQLSVLYLKSPPPSTVKPYPVQVFGTLQWKNRPVIFVKILQVLTTSNAIRIRNALKNLVEKHRAEHSAVMDQP